MRTCQLFAHHILLPTYIVTACRIDVPPVAHGVFLAKCTTRADPWVERPDVAAAVAADK